MPKTTRDASPGDIYVHGVNPDTQEEARRLVQRDIPTANILFVERIKANKWHAVLGEPKAQVTCTNCGETRRELQPTCLFEAMLWCLVERDAMTEAQVLALIGTTDTAELDSLWCKVLGPALDNLAEYLMIPSVPSKTEGPVG